MLNLYVKFNELFFGDSNVRVLDVLTVVAFIVVMAVMVKVRYF